MKITRENYEPFFLDYLEGNLDEHLIDGFLEFLQQNPDLKNELRSFENIPLPEDEIPFSGKEKLYRQELDQPETFQYRAIASLEGDLSPDEEEEFNEYVASHPQAAQEYARFRMTKLQPDHSVTYAQKDKLYRQPAIRPLIFTVMRVAAVLLVAVTIWSIWPDETREILNRPVISEVVPVPADPGPDQPSGDNSRATDPAGTPSTAQNQSFPQTVSGNKRPHQQSDNQEAVRPEAGKQIDPVLHIPVSTQVNSSGLNGQLADIPVSRRETMEIPGSLPSIKPALGQLKTETLIAAANPVEQLSREDQSQEEAIYLTDRLRERAGLENFSFSKLVRSGIDLASDLSGEKVSYATSDDGSIVALSLNTRLLGLRIPVGRK